MLNPRGVLLKALTDAYVSKCFPHLPLRIHCIWQRIKAHLEDVHWEEDWDKLCASAPHDFYGRHFDRPDSCVNRVGSIIAKRLVFAHDICRGYTECSVYGILMILIAKTNNECVCDCHPVGNCSFFLLSFFIIRCPFLVRSSPLLSLRLHVCWLTRLCTILTMLYLYLGTLDLLVDW
jgi:hypothetical protein